MSISSSSYVQIDQLISSNALSKSKYKSAVLILSKLALTIIGNALCMGSAYMNGGFNEAYFSSIAILTITPICYACVLPRTVVHTYALTGKTPLIPLGDVAKIPEKESVLINFFAAAEFLNFAISCCNFGFQEFRESEINPQVKQATLIPVVVLYFAAFLHSIHTIEKAEFRFR